MKEFSARELNTKNLPAEDCFKYLELAVFSYLLSFIVINFSKFPNIIRF